MYLSQASEVEREYNIFTYLSVSGTACESELISFLTLFACCLHLDKLKVLLQWLSQSFMICIYFYIKTLIFNLISFPFLHLMISSVHPSECTRIQLGYNENGPGFGRYRN